MTTRVPLGGRLERLLPALACPACRHGLESRPDCLACTSCEKRYPVRAGKVYFIDPLVSASDELDTLKGRLKRRLGRFYHTVGIRFVAPVYPFDFSSIMRRVDPSTQLVVNIGCGNHRLHPDMIGLDIADYDATDVVADVAALPFKPASIDAFVSVGVLEHLPDVRQAVDAFRRCSRPGAHAIHTVPFLFPLHASPHDFVRFTRWGCEQLFHGHDDVGIEAVQGPVSLLLLTLTEVLSIIATLGSRRLQPYAYLLFCLLLFPVKYLDALFLPFRAFDSLAPLFLVTARIPRHEASRSVGADHP